MPRKKVWPPRVYPHPSGQDRIRVRVNGKPEDIWLGKSGTPEARQEYLRVIAELEANQGVPPPKNGVRLLVSDLVERYLVHVNEYQDRRQANRIQSAIRPVFELYGAKPVEAFGPNELRAVQAHMIQKDWSRNYINAALPLIRQCWKWGVSHDLLSLDSYLKLKTVDGLRKGKTKAKELPPRLHVPDSVVEATLPFLPPPVQGLVQFQWLTGARPGEAVILRPMDLDKEAFVVDGIPVWVYRPESHKGEWRGHWRAVCVGPRCQALLAEFLARDPDLYCFSPRDHGKNLKTKNDRFRLDCYARTVHEACVKAGVQHWSPYQLRHSMATRIELEDARAYEGATCVLGHYDPGMAKVYAHGKLQRAAKIAAKFG